MTALIYTLSLKKKTGLCYNFATNRLQSAIKKAGTITVDRPYSISNTTMLLPENPPHQQTGTCFEPRNPPSSPRLTAHRYPRLPWLLNTDFRPITHG